MKYKSIYVINADSWILRYLGNDIIECFSKKGYKCNQGNANDYNGEDICFHMWWRQAVPIKKAKVNAVFITHTDDKLKEKELLSIKEKFDYFFPMSPEDGSFLVELGFDKRKVNGINLPVRNKYVRPISIGIFSNCYKDTRKNEQWLLDYCKNNKNSSLVTFVFIGSGWSDFVNRLSEIDCSFEWIHISRNLPYEYMYQQIELSKVDYYLYMGMDGGAMGTYDAYAMGLDLCIADDGYHKCIPDISYSFTNKDGFFQQLDKIILKQKRKIDFFTNNTSEKYVEKIIKTFDGDICDDNNVNYSVVEKRRANYFPIKRIRLFDHIFQMLYKKKHG